MSRIGLKPISIPASVKVNIEGSKVVVTGPKGTLTKEFSPFINFAVNENVIHITRQNETKEVKQLHGTTRALLANMITGVTEGFKKEIVMKGIGYKAAMRGNDLVLNVGYSHEIVLQLLPGITIEIKTPTELAVVGIDKQSVGQIAAEIRGTRPPEPYLGKGVAYKNEKIRRKEGKKAGKK